MNVFDLFARVSLDTSGYNRSLRDASSLSSNFVSSVGNGFKALAKVGTVALTAASGVISKVLKDSISAYADYEQLVGGVETLFKNSADIVMEYASNAYKTAGLSANEYMETVTSFSASLLQSLNGDTQKATDYANMAITDMADNANKMGSSMESIQNAYQGFAKQNYTMLDNLKLGYGGTASEMYRLLQTAAELDDEFAKTADFELDAKGHLEAGYADIVKAIHIVQNEMDITGTTAKEASTTISGSVASMKSAWQNLITGIADNNADLDNLIGNLVDSAETAFNNLLPAAEKALGGIGSFIERIAPILSEKLPSVIDRVLPALISSATSLVSGLVKALPGTIQALVEQIPSVISQLAKAVVDTAPMLISVVKDLGKMLWSYIQEYAPQLIKEAVETIPKLIQGITSALPQVASVVIEFMSMLGESIRENLPTLINAGMNALMDFSGSLRENFANIFDAGLDLLMALADGLIAGIPTFIQTIPTIVSNIAGLINDNAPKLIKAGVDLIAKLVVGIVEAVPVLIAEFPKIIKAIWDVITAFNWMNLGSKVITWISDGVKALATNIPTLFKNIGTKAFDTLKNINWLDLGKKVIEFIVNGIKALATHPVSTLKTIGTNALNAFKNINWLQLGSNVINFIVNGIKSLISSIPNTLLSIGTKAKDTFLSIDWLGIGKDVVSGIVKGIVDNAKSVINAITDLAKKAWDGIKDFFGIHSPSKKMAWIGEMFDAGLAGGISVNASEVEKAVDDLAAITEKPFGVNLAGNSGIGVNSGSSSNTVYITVYGAQGQDVNQLAEIIEERLSNSINRRGVGALA